MSREEMLKKLQSIPEPLFRLHIFSDGVVCEYMCAKGMGSFEVVDWQDLAEVNSDHADSFWEDMEDCVLQEYVELLEDEDCYAPYQSVLADIEDVSGPFES